MLCNTSIDQFLVLYTSLEKNHEDGKFYTNFISIYIDMTNKIKRRRRNIWSTSEEKAKTEK